MKQSLLTALMLSLLALPAMGTEDGSHEATSTVEKFHQALVAPAHA